MKPLSLLFSLLFLCVFSALAQDTAKTAKPDTLTTRQKIRKYRPSPPGIRNFFTSPQELHRRQHQQDSIFDKMLPEQHHPGIYFDFGFGGAFIGIHGFEGSYSLNYENKNSLFTFRGLGTIAYTDTYTEITPFNYFPGFKTENSLGEYALMYGWRFINNKHNGLSFSLGISSDRRTFYYYYPKAPTEKTNEYYAGLPFEANYNWFMSRFGVGGGFKVMGNISQHSFIGLGIDLSVGFHKTH